jgi:hypothetical protein
MLMTIGIPSDAALFSWNKQEDACVWSCECFSFTPCFFIHMSILLPNAIEKKTFFHGFG